MMTIIHNLNRFALKLAIAAAMLAAMPSMTGCQKGTPETSKDLTGIPGEQFAPANEPRHMHRIADASAASGARADATLHRAHFDGGNQTALNSLGEQKLDLMLADDDALPVAIYLNVIGDDVFAACEQSVRVYLRDRGLGEQQIKVVAGRNPGGYQATAPLIRQARVAENQAAAGGQGGAAGGTTVK